MVAMTVMRMEVVVMRRMLLVVKMALMMREVF